MGLKETVENTLEFSLINAMRMSKKYGSYDTSKLYELAVDEMNKPVEESEIHGVLGTIFLRWVDAGGEKKTFYIDPLPTAEQSAHIGLFLSAINTIALSEQSREKSETQQQLKDLLESLLDDKD